MSTVRRAYERVRERIADAAQRSGRNPEQVLLVAVTKYADPAQMQELMDLGHRDFGENRAQQLEERAAAFGGDAETGTVPRWHMVGRLQRNKAKKVVPWARLVHSVDTVPLAETIHSAAGERMVDVLVQVNASGEPQKAGLAPPAVTHVVEQLHTLAHLRLRGLMTMAPASEDPEDARPAFARTAEVFEEVRGRGLGGDAFDLLSMGMSGDFEVGIEEGANVIRVGSALFDDLGSS